MINPRHLLRMARWAHRPPSWQRVLVVSGVIAAALILAGIEHFVGWPDALTTDPGAMRMPRPRAD